MVQDALEPTNFSIHTMKKGPSTLTGLFKFLLIISIITIDSLHFFCSFYKTDTVNSLCNSPQSFLREIKSLNTLTQITNEKVHFSPGQLFDDL